MTSPLGEALVEDHRRLIRGFADLKKALEREEPAEAGRIADQLDPAAGPHIRFEEEVLYSRVAEARGRPFADQLYADSATFKSSCSGGCGGPQSADGAPA